MRAVTGFVSSTKLVSISRAADELSIFVASHAEARRDIAAYLNRASTALDDLVLFHREVGVGRRSEGREIHEKTKKRPRREAEGRPTRMSAEEIGSIKDEEGQRGRFGDCGEGNLTELDCGYGGEVARVESRKNKKGKRKRTLHEVEKSDLDRNKEIVGVEVV